MDFSTFQKSCLKDLDTFRPMASLIATPSAVRSVRHFTWNRLRRSMSISLWRYDLSRASYSLALSRYLTTSPLADSKPRASTSSSPTGPFSFCRRRPRSSRKPWWKLCPLMSRMCRPASFLRSTWPASRWNLAARKTKHGCYNSSKRASSTRLGWRLSSSDIICPKNGEDSTSNSYEVKNDSAIE